MEEKYLEKRLHKDRDDFFGNRTQFQRDRDRIIHSRAFRRMMHKTQVFQANESDHYRNRLTHTLEVSQIARSIGKALNLNNELVEAIALGHDLGHTPFGHIGERTLDGIISGKFFQKGDIKIEYCGEFKHNFQSVRLIDSLETICNEYQGLNLTNAVRDGILKHTHIHKKNTTNIIDYEGLIDLRDIDTTLPHSITLEGQVVAIADEIAQVTHDIEDSLRGRIIDWEDIKNEKLIVEYLEIINQKDSITDRRTALINQTLKGLVGLLIKDVCDTSLNNIQDYHNNNGLPSFSGKTEGYQVKCISFSAKRDQMVKSLNELKKTSVLNSQEISVSDSKAQYIIRQIFKAYYMHPAQLPDQILIRYYDSIKQTFNRNTIHEKMITDRKLFIRCICDHIAGMTDQFAAREYKKLYIPDYF